LQENLRNFCRRYQVIYNEEPHLLSPRSHTWLIQDVDGKKWVAKEKSPHDPVVELLNNFKMLHPCFDHPQPVSEYNEDYCLYPYIVGMMLADGPFEDPEIIEKVFELAGRLQALFRSLILVPFYQETLRSKGFEGDFNSEVSRFGLGRVQQMDDRHKSARHREIAQSYQWTEQKLEYCINQLVTRALWSGTVLSAFRNKIHNSFAIHMPITGSNLSHTSFHPEHVLFCRDKSTAIVGWHIEPRPRFYMMYTYLAWSFVHSKREDAKEYYRSYLAENSSKAFHREHHLVFAFCLMEQIVDSLAKHPKSQFNHSPEKERQAAELFTECLKNLS